MQLAKCVILLHVVTTANAASAQGFGYWVGQYAEGVGSQFVGFGKGLVNVGNELVYMGHDAALGVGNVATYAATFGSVSYDYESWSGLQQKFDEATLSNMSMGNMYYESSKSGGEFLLHGATFNLINVGNGLYKDVQGPVGSNQGMQAYAGTAVQAGLAGYLVRGPGGSLQGGFWSVPMTRLPPVTDAITRYQSGPHCEVINGSLRAGRFLESDLLGDLYSSSDAALDVAAMDAAAVPASQTQIVFRQCGRLASSEGLTDRAFISTTTIADGGFGLQGGPISAITIPRGTPIIQTPTASPFSIMAEIILPRGASFVPNGAGGFTYVPAPTLPPIPFGANLPAVAPPSVLTFPSIPVLPVPNQFDGSTNF